MTDDDRKTEPVYIISSPGTFSSGELKPNAKQCYNIYFSFFFFFFWGGGGGGGVISSFQIEHTNRNICICKSFRQVTAIHLQDSCGLSV